MDLIHKLTNWIDHNRYVVLAAVLLGVILVVGVGCESTTSSISDPTVQVDRVALEADIADVNATLATQAAMIDAEVAKYNAQVTGINAKIDAAVADLDRQDEMKAELFNLAGSAVTAIASGGVDTSAVIGTAITAGSLLFSIGVAADNQRKDKIIAKQKTITTTTSPDPIIEDGTTTS